MGALDPQGTDTGMCSDLTPWEDAGDSSSTSLTDETGNVLSVLTGNPPERKVEAMDTRATVGTPSLCLEIPTETGAFTSGSQKLSPLQGQRHSPDLEKQDHLSNPPGFAYCNASSSFIYKSSVHIISDDGIFSAIDARSATSQAGPGLEGQPRSESDLPRLRQSKQVPIRQISPALPGRVAGGTPSCEPLATIAESPRRKSFAVAQARIFE